MAGISQHVSPEAQLILPQTTGAVVGPLSTTSLPAPSVLPLLLPEEEEPLLLEAVSMAASVTPLLLPELLLDVPLPDPLLLLPLLLLVLPLLPLLLPELLVEPLPEPLLLAFPLLLPELSVLLSRPPSPPNNNPVELSEPQAAVTAIPTETKKKILELLMVNDLL